MANTGLAAAVGCNRFRSLSVVNGAAQQIKASAGVLFAAHICNRSAGTKYVKFYNSTSATAGTETPFLTIPVEGNATNNVTMNLLCGPRGVYFDTGICIAATTGFADNDTGAPAANEVVVNAFYL